ncbi:MAG: PAS domain S-box protein [Deltaproteobacteria bacterium]|nr:PAS domain S-box protein [Deltaproteobacteria bacterium]
MKGTPKTEAQLITTLCKDERSGTESTQYARNDPVENIVFEDLINSLPGIFYVYDEQGHLRWWNNKSVEVTGYTPEELKTKKSTDFFDGAEAEFIENQLQKAFVHGEADAEAHLVTKRGRRVPYYFSGACKTIHDKPYLIGLGIDITKSKQADQELQHTKEFLENIIENSPDGIFVTDKTGSIIRSNRRMSSISGYPMEELIGMQMHALAPPHPGNYESTLGHTLDITKHYFSTAQAAMQTLTASGKISQWDSYYRRKDNRLVPVEINAAHLKDSQGGLIGTVVTARDTTERKLNVASLRESTNRYRSVFENTGTATIIFGEDTIITLANTEAERLSGFTRAEIIGKKSWTEFIFKEDLGYMLLYHEQRSRQHSVLPQNYECRLLTRDGALRNIHLTISMIPGTTQRVASLNDITERRSAENNLRESEKKFRSLFEESQDMIIITTADGDILDINPAGIKGMGYESKEAIMLKNVALLYSDPDARERFKQIMQRDGVIKNSEFELKQKDGRTLTMIGTSTSVKDSEGTITAYRSILRDITERRLLQQQLFQAQKMESIGTLAGGIAHDFNNILSGILGYAQFMKNKIEASTHMYRCVDTIEKGALRAAELTSQLLTFARKGKYIIKPININILIDETLKIISRTFDRAIKIDTSLSDELPAVTADAGQIQQVLLNLFVNARDAMPAGGRLCISTATEMIKVNNPDNSSAPPQRPFVTLSITDTGHGMEPDTIKRIFDPFFTTKAQDKGTGLGLSMAYKILENHNGFITVDSTPNSGTTFKVYLPISDKPVEKPEPNAKRTNLRGSECILIIDDIQEVLDVTDDILSEFGYHVLQAKSGAAAIDHFCTQSNKISAVILDIIMPDIGGLETFLKLKAIDPQVRVLISSGLNNEHFARELMQLGALGYLSKPFQTDALLEKLRDVIDVS